MPTRIQATIVVEMAPETEVWDSSAGRIPLEESHTPLLYTQCLTWQLNLSNSILENSVLKNNRKKILNKLFIKKMEKLQAD